MSWLFNSIRQRYAMHLKQIRTGRGGLSANNVRWESLMGSQIKSLLQETGTDDDTFRRESWAGPDPFSSLFLHPSPSSTQNFSCVMSVTNQICSGQNFAASYLAMVSSNRGKSGTGEKLTVSAFERCHSCLDSNSPPRDPAHFFFESYICVDVSGCSEKL